MKAVRLRPLSAEEIHNCLGALLEVIKEKAAFHFWLLGHFHNNRILGEHSVLHWEQKV